MEALSHMSPSEPQLDAHVGELHRSLAEQDRLLAAEKALEEPMRLALTMTRSEDIAAVAEAVYRGIDRLGLPIWRCIVETFDDEYHAAKQNTLWLTTPDGELWEESFTFTMARIMRAHPALMALHECRLRWEDDYYCVYLSGEELRSFNRVVAQQASLPGHVVEHDDKPNHEYLHYFLPSDRRSDLCVVMFEPLSSADRGILHRFAELFGFAYARHLDFQALVASNRQVEQTYQAKSRFLANMSHELRTPLNTILNFTSLILEEAYGELATQLRDAVEEIDRNGDRLLAVIDDILEISRAESGSVDLNVSDCVPEACIDTAIAALEHDAAVKGLVVLREPGSDLPLFKADERRLTQHVLINLLKNAIKYTDAGEIRLGARVAGHCMLFWVADTGIGVVEEERERVFQSFYQATDGHDRRDEGTGLGLAIARQFVELHGGRIWVESEPGQGSTFYFEVRLQ